MKLSFVSVQHIYLNDTVNAIFYERISVSLRNLVCIISTMPGVKVTGKQLEERHFAIKKNILIKLVLIENKDTYYAIVELSVYYEFS